MTDQARWPRWRLNERGDKGLIDPWRTSQKGPLREVIITAHHEWFEAADAGDLDSDTLFSSARTQREDEFVEKAIEWLETRFGETVITARADFDETAPHVHAIIAPWVTKTGKRKGTQQLLVPHAHKLLRSYEEAQTDIGKFFVPLGLVRGERRAKARRKAEKKGKKKPRYAANTLAHEYRKLEGDRLRKKAAKLKKGRRELKRAHAAQKAELEALRAELAAQKAAQDKKQEDLDGRETALEAREAANDDRQREVEGAEAVLDSAAGGTVVDAGQNADEPALVKRIREKLVTAFEVTRTAAVAAARPEIDRQMAIAQHLANKARALQSALELAVSRTVLPVILRKIEGEEHDVQAAETAARPSVNPAPKSKPGEEIGGD